MAIKAQSKMVPAWYVPRAERDEAGEALPDATRFKLRGLTGKELSFIQPELIVGEVNGVPMVTGTTGKGGELALYYGLRDWENFRDDDGPLAFSQGNFERIDIQTRTELVMQIIAGSFITPEEKKT